jgi:hypothetical protein
MATPWPWGIFTLTQARYKLVIISTVSSYLLTDRSMVSSYLLIQRNCSVLFAPPQAVNGVTPSGTVLGRYIVTLSCAPPSVWHCFLFV